MMKNASLGYRRLLTALFTALTLSMILTPATFAQVNLQQRAPQVEIIPSSYAPAPAPQVKFVAARVEQNVKVDGIWGIKLHINFIIQDANCPCRTVAYFYDDSDGTALEGNYPAYNDAAGKVAVGSNFTPTLNPAQYKDFTLWLPFRALNLEQTSGNEFFLRFKVNVYDSAVKRRIGISEFYTFTIKFR